MCGVGMLPKAPPAALRVFVERGGGPRHRPPHPSASLTRISVPAPRAFTPNAPPPSNPPPTPLPTPQLVRSLTVCRVLIVPRAAYNAIASDFTQSARAVLENLQRMAETLVQQARAAGGCVLLFCVFLGAVFGP